MSVTGSPSAMLRDTPYIREATVATGLCLLIFLHLVSPLFFSTLRQFPGPIWAKLSPFWLTMQSRLTRRSRAIMQLHRKYGDFVQVAPNHISINNPAALAEIYGHRTGFLKADFYDAFVQVQPGVFNTRDVQVHSRKRRYMNPAFSSRALSEFEPYMNNELLLWKNQLIKMIDGKHSTVVDFAEWTNFLAFDIVGSFAFGEPFGFLAKGCDYMNLISTMDRRGEVLNALGTVPVSMRPFMKYNVFDSFWYTGLRANSNMGKFGTAAYQRRKQNPESRKDFLAFMFSAKDPETGKPLPEEEIIAESISFIAGGSDTTSSTITNFIDIVSRDRQTQKRLQAELDEAFPGDQSEFWVADDKTVQKLPVLVATLREVIRVRPTSATGLERVTPKGGKSICGVYIPEGTVVSVPTCGVFEDGRAFQEPSRFNLDRWMGDDTEGLLGVFVPFSTGPRACIGRNFAWMEILKTLATLFKLFNVERATTEPTTLREGFFNKATECHAFISRR